MADFKPALDLALLHEGGLVDDPIDEGEITKYGISYNFIKLLQKVDSEYQDWDETSIVNLTVEEAENLYLKHFWMPGNYGILPDQQIANLLFSMGVLTSLRRPIKLFQEALNDESFPGYPVLEIDGRLGSKTVRHLNKCIEEQKERNVLSLFRCYMTDYFLEKVRKKPEKNRFLRGWLNRLYQI